MSEHTHPSQQHEHRHYHLLPYFAGLGPGQDWQERFVWHSHPHDHPGETHDHPFSRSEEEDHHDRFAHTHDNGDYKVRRQPARPLAKAAGLD